MILLLDTSILIEALRRKGDPQVKRFVSEKIAQRLAAYTCPVYFECIQGLMHHESPLVTNTFAACHRIYFDAEDWETSAKNQFHLRRKGLTVSAPDVMIWTVALRRKLALATTDRDFTAINAWADTPVELVTFG